MYLVLAQMLQMDYWSRSTLSVAREALAAASASVEQLAVVDTASAVAEVPAVGAWRCMRLVRLVLAQQLAFELAAPSVRLQ